MLDIGFQELIVVFVIALLVFGPKKLPEIGRSLGKGIGELRRALDGVKETLSAEEENIRKSVEETSGDRTSGGSSPEGPVRHDPDSPAPLTGSPESSGASSEGGDTSGEAADSSVGTTAEGPSEQSRGG